MKSSSFGLVTGALALLQLLFSSCHSFRSVTFSEALRYDTVMYSGNANYLGPFYIKIGEQKTDRNRQKTLLSTKEEHQEVFSFTICGKEDCAEANSYFYTKTKKSHLLSGDNGGGTRIKAEKLYGSIYIGKQDTMSFMVDVAGKKPGKGFLTSPRDMMIIIEPISKKSTYGKKAYGVGLEFKRDGKTIGGFIQSGEMINVVIKRSETGKMKLVLAALAVSLVNRSNEIRIL